MTDEHTERSLARNVADLQWQLARARRHVVVEKKRRRKINDKMFAKCSYADNKAGKCQR